MAYPKGKPRPPTSGRKKGRKNNRTECVEAYARGIVEDKEVQAQIVLQARAGELPPPVLTMLFHYAYGKPRDNRDDMVDNLAFVQSLLAVVMKHATTGDAQREVHEVIQAHLGANRLRTVA